MKLTTIVTAILAGVNVVVLAKSCKHGGVYCGQSLLNRGKWTGSQGRFWPYGHSKSRGVSVQVSKILRLTPFISFSSIGNYRDHIIETLKAARQPTDEPHIISSLFDCLKNGELRYRDYCGKGCGGVGSKDADYCL